MSPEVIRRKVLEALREVQALSGRKWNDLRPDSKPIGALDGFDSLAAVETTVLIEQKLGCNFDIESAFVSADGKRALTIRDISERLAGLLAEKGGKR